MKRNNPFFAKLLIFLSNYHIPVLGKLVRIILNSDIYCKLPKSVYMGHPYGIVIHSKTIIGENVTIMQHVTIGTRNEHEDDAPVIGDNVFIGAGAKIIGNVIVGDNVKIGANAIVTRTIPPNCTVINANVILKKDTSK